MRFEFATATRILFGPGTSSQVASEAAAMGTHAMIVTGGTPERIDHFLDSVSGAGLSAVPFSIPREPDVSLIEEGATTLREEGCDIVIGIGGGSVIDAAKAIAAIGANNGELTDYLEVIGKGKSLLQPSLPCIVLPTTAGTGAEVTKNAVITSPERRVKVSLRSPYLLPRLSVIDPELTFTLPAETTAATGLDALTQCIEAYVSVRAQPLTDGFCLEGIKRASRSLRRACTNGNDAAAREDMAAASLLSGMALTNAGLGAVHGFASPVGGICGIAHGAVCALLLPQVMEMNVAVLQKEQPQAPALDRYTTIARICTGNPKASAGDGVRWLHELCRELPLPSADRFGLSPDRYPEIVTATAKASSMKGNPVLLTEMQLTHILEETFMI
ncbi:MAG: iron-containing alcohol dehydrogenase [Chitinispirillaceae bacterium]|nr:iron-containing alcohol dehydrogenase [Chitinispirillaceae bacterium]